MGLSSMLLAAAAVDALIGLAVTLVVARRSQRRLRIDPLAVVVGSGTSLAVGLIQASVLLEDEFSRLHLGYLVMVVALPLLGLGVAAAWAMGRRIERVEVTRAAGGAAVALMALGVAGLWGTHVEPYRLRTDTAVLDVAQIEPDDDPIRVGVLADLQTVDIGEHEWDAVRRLNEADVDLVLLPGDYIEGNEAAFLGQLPELLRLLQALDAPSGVFLVAGDTDSPYRIDLMGDDTGLVALDNEVTSTSVQGRLVWIGGTELEYGREDAAAAIEQLAGSGGDRDLRILVAHRPDAGYRAAATGRIDLVVSGHTHGGQIALPLIGPLVTRSGVPRAVAAGGLSELTGQPIYVSTGVGLVRATAPQVRFLARPSVGVVTLS